METKIIRINPKEIKLLELNARFMKADEYQRLVNNVKRDGKLTSVPFCCYNDNWELEVLSGNHRVQAAIDAGLEEIEVMITEETLTKDQKIGIQLSHNSISGQDDVAILKELYSQIDDVAYKEYSGLDDATLKMLDDISAQSFSGSGLEFQVLNVAFLPSEMREIGQTLSKVKKEVGKNKTLVARMKEYDSYMDRMLEVGESHNIKNTATMFMAMLKLVENHLDELKDIWVEAEDSKRNVPVSTLLGKSSISIQDGKVANQAIEQLVSRGEIKKTEKDKALAVLSQKYLDSLKDGKKK